MPVHCGAPPVIETQPALDFAANINQRQEPLVRKLLPRSAIEALNHRIVLRRTTSREIQLYIVLIGPAVHELVGKLFTAV